MTYLLIRHRVAEFAAWKVAYDAHASARSAAGLKDKEILRDINDPNQIILIFEVGDVQMAKEFSASSSLQEAMRGAGVTDKPDLYFLQH